MARCRFNIYPVRPIEGQLTEYLSAQRTAMRLRLRRAAGLRQRSTSSKPQLRFTVPCALRYGVLAEFDMLATGGLERNAAHKGLAATLTISCLLPGSWIQNRNNSARLSSLHKMWTKTGSYSSQIWGDVATGGSYSVASVARNKSARHPKRSMFMQL